MTTNRLIFDLNDLAKECHSIAASKGWDDVERSFGDEMALIHSELSEALEEYRNGALYNEVYYSNGNKPEGIPVELGDVIIRVLHFCAKHNIDIDSVVRLKMEFNRSRQHRHGGKVI